MTITRLALSFVFALPLSAGAAVGTVHKDFSAAGITQLAVRSVDGDISIAPGAAGTIGADMTYDAEKCELTAETRGKMVFLEARRKKRWQFFSFGSKDQPCAKFDIKVPAGMDLNPVSVSVDLKVEGVNGPVTGKTVSGDALVSGSAGLSLTTVSGDLEFSGAAGKIYLKTTSGDISGGIVSSGDVEARTVSGGISLKVLKPAAKGVFSLETVSGDVKLGFPKGAKAAATFHSVSGEQSNNIINDPEAGLKIKVETTSGDLALNAMAQ